MTSRKRRPKPLAKVMGRSWLVGHERVVIATLLALHVAVVLWGMSRNSVTFDENFHVPSGVVYVTRGDPSISPVNPPLVKALFGVAALAAGARPPSESAIATRSHLDVAMSFMRLNADRYHRIYTAARVVTLLLSVGLAVLVWRFARRLYGREAGLAASALYVFTPDALAHAGFATLDVATALAWLLALWALWGFARSGRAGWGVALAASAAFAILVRFTSAILFPILVGLAALAHATGAARRPARLWIGLAMLVPVAWVALIAGYLGHVSFGPPAGTPLEMPAMRHVAAILGRLHLPFPSDLYRGLDQQLQDARPGHLTTYVFGHTTSGAVRWYFPLAIALKWPLAFLAAVLTRAGCALVARPDRRTLRRDLWLVIPAAAFLGSAVALGGLNAGVRYMLPLIPMLCVWCSGALAPAPRLPGLGARVRGFGRAAVLALAIAQPVEVARALPYPLTFFNAFAGRNPDRMLNDSNVDWGQGLIALRGELERRGIRRVYLTYHGMTDPALYGIDYVPYVGGIPGDESDWLAVSSYFYVGLPARMVTQQGLSDAGFTIDFRPIWGIEPDARPGRCMYLIRLR